MSALRWSLLILGLVFFAGLALWEMRRPRQARSDDLPPEPTRPREATLEPPLQLPEMHAREPLAVRSLPVVEVPEEPDEFPVLAAAETGAADPAEEIVAEAGEAPVDALEEAPLEAPLGVAADAPVEAHESTGEPPEASVQGDEAPAEAHAEISPGTDALLVEWPPDDQRRVVALRLVATQTERFAGRSLRQALAAEGFVLGRFDIFHKPDGERRAVLSAASLTRPGTFDVDTMDSQHFGGLSLFAVLPGPKSPPEAFEELVTTARSLNERLCGVLQDEGGTPLTPQRIASLKARLNSGAPA